MYIHVDTHTTQLQERFWEGRIVGYSWNSETYRIYNPEMRRVLESWNMDFSETPATSVPYKDVEDSSNQKSTRLYSDEDYYMLDVFDYLVEFTNPEEREQAATEITARQGSQRQLIQ